MQASDSDARLPRFPVRLELRTMLVAGSCIAMRNFFGAPNGYCPSFPQLNLREDRSRATAYRVINDGWEVYLARDFLATARIVIKRTQFSTDRPGGWWSIIPRITTRRLRVISFPFSSYLRAFPAAFSRYGTARLRDGLNTSFLMKLESASSNHDCEPLFMSQRGNLSWQEPKDDHIWGIRRHNCNERFKKDVHGRKSIVGPHNTGWHNQIYAWVNYTVSFVWVSLLQSHLSDKSLVKGWYLR